MRLVEDLRRKGYSFVFKKNDAWQEMEEIKILEKVRHSLRDCKRTREKRNAGTKPVGEGSKTNTNSEPTAETKTK